jgi:uncharacterized membrane protein
MPLEQTLVRTFRAGTLIAAGIITLGFAASGFDLGVTLPGGRKLDGSALMILGIVLFVLMPIGGVALSARQFYRESDRRLVAIAIGVLLVLLIGFVIGVRSGRTGH